MSDNYWDKVRNSGLGGYGHGNSKFSKVIPQRHFARARAFAFGGSGANREALQNSLGMITKKQIEFANNQTGIFGKALGYGGTLAIPGFSLYMMNEAVKEGQQVGQYASETIAPQVGMFYGGRVGANLGAGLQKGAGGSGMAGRFYGGLSGAAVGMAAAYGIASTISGSVTANNTIQNVRKKMYDSDLNRDLLQTNNTLTHRQAALQAISKSAMNNRGQMMGNEASILYGS